MVLLFGCGGGGGSSAGGGGSNTLFYAVKATTPTFAATTSAKPQNAKGKIYSAPSFSDPAMMVAFQLLRNYSYPADEGKIDMSNIYKILWEAGGKLDDAKYLCSSMTSTTDSAISPYLFSDFLGHSYTCGGNIDESVQPGYGSSFAYEETGTLRKMLASYKWAPDVAQQIAIGTIQASYDDTTKNVELIFAQAVNYPAGSTMGGPSGSGFATRARITGNSDTHDFELKMFTGSTSLVGKGKSQGAGNYFLIRDGSNYFCIPAGATETDLAGMQPMNQTDANASPNCGVYATAVTAMTSYTGADLPNIDLSDFNNGVRGTPVNYLMF
ncbi:MAG: hypothetical protein A2X58_11425 [Nitrospirae bacterium GWC2_56_14]|nr:MAG: hypothetical protein A2X58_11425 [Nitrospirae bacterium GWC2_56_14]